MKKIIRLLTALSLGAALTSWAAGGKENWDNYCAKCHGADGKGQTNIGRRLGTKDYSDSQVQAGLKDEAITKAIKEGVKDKNGNTIMKPTAGLSDDEVTALAAYMRTLKK